MVKAASFPVALILLAGISVSPLYAQRGGGGHMGGMGGGHMGGMGGGHVGGMGGGHIGGMGGRMGGVGAPIHGVPMGGFHGGMPLHGGFVSGRPVGVHGAPWGFHQHVGFRPWTSVGLGLWLGYPYPYG